MSGLFDGLNIPTDYDADVRIHIAPNTMLFLGGIAFVLLAAKKKGII